MVDSNIDNNLVEEGDELDILKSYICECCGKRFERPQYLMSHVESYEGAKERFISVNAARNVFS